jgi:hypothetical protein
MYLDIHISRSIAKTMYLEKAKTNSNLGRREYKQRIRGKQEHRTCATFFDLLLVVIDLSQGLRRSKCRIEWNSGIIKLH